jgi:hypothetical protein
MQNKKTVLMVKDNTKIPAYLCEEKVDYLIRNSQSQSQEEEEGRVTDIIPTIQENPEDSIDSLIMDCDYTMNESEDQTSQLDRDLEPSDYLASDAHNYRIPELQATQIVDTDDHDSMEPLNIHEVDRYLQSILNNNESFVY